MYWVLSGQPEDDISGTIINGLLIDLNKQITGNILNDGKPVLERHPSFYIKPFAHRCRFGLITDRLAVNTTGINLFVVSTVFKRFLEKEVKGIECIPVKFLEQDLGFEYFIINPLLKVDCIDEELSWYLPVSRSLKDFTIYEIKNLAIDESKVPKNLDLFLLGRTNLSVILVSERLKLEIENRFSGCKFLPPKEFSI